MKLNNSEFSILSPTIMGICNVTKDSFSDGGKNFKTSDALKSIKQMLNDGAQIIDIGAERVLDRVAIQLLTKKK